MPTTAQEFYAEAVRALPLAERLRLGPLLLGELARPGLAVVAEGPDWGGDEAAEVTAFALRYAESVYPEGDELV